MRRTILVLIPVLTLVGAGWVFGQARTGEIYGAVQDPEGNPLPGVTVSLTSVLIGQQATVTGVDGMYRFPSLPPGTDYTLRFQLEGFNTVVREAVVVRVGVSTRVDVKLAPGAAEEIVVRGGTPVVDVKKTEVGSNLTREALQEVPSARDPWVMLELAPGVMIDRVNVGGSQSGQQSGVFARGTDLISWNYDGVDYTYSPDGYNASNGYFDYDAFEELQVVNGANDVSSFHGGISFNIVTRRGTNRLSGTGRFYWTSKDLQSTNFEDVQKDFVNPRSRGNRVGDIFDYGGSLGGPAVRDKIWFWGSYGVQDIKQLIPTITQEDLTDKTFLEAVNTKFNMQLGKHMLEFLFFWYDKEKHNRGAGPTRPVETTWDQKGPMPTYKIQDEFFATDDLFLSIRGGFVSNVWWLTPKGGMDKPVILDNATGIWHNTYYSLDEATKFYHLVGQGIYYKSNWLGGDHEIKFGTEFAYRPQLYKIGWGNGTVFVYDDLSNPALGGHVRLIRPQRHTRYYRRWSLYAQDIFRISRVTLLLGLRYDMQQNGYRDGHLDANPLRPDLFPAVDVNGRNLMTWHTLSPRFGITYDVFGNARTLLKANAALYVEPIGVEAPTLVSPLSIKQLWFDWVGDLNGNGVPDADELGDLIFWDHEPGNPNRIVNSFDLDPPRYFEVVLGLEQQIGQDLGIAVNGFWRRMWDLRWNFPYDPDGEITADDIYGCWQEAGRLPAEFGGWPYYYCTIPKPEGVILTNRPDYHRTYLGLELRFTKRMSHGWMAFGSLTLQDQKEHYDSDRAFFDPTNTAQTDDRVYWLGSWGTSGVFARWLVKAGFVLQLPLDVTLGASFNAREGYVFPPVFLVNRPSNGWGPNVLVYTEKVGESHLPTFWMLNARLEKTFSFEFGRLYLSLDGFNLTNNNMALQWFNRANVPDLFKKIQEIVAPRVFRLGARFEF